MNRAIFFQGVKTLRQELRSLYHTRYKENKEFIQHGDTSVYQHCVSVAYCSILIAAKLNIQVDMPSMIRGALFHDYFLYDWHDKPTRNRVLEGKLHGFHHPRVACENASRDFSLNQREQDIIRKHMFPLTIQPPAYREGWIICTADKICSIQETFNLRVNKKKKHSLLHIPEPIKQAV